MDLINLVEKISKLEKPSIQYFSNACLHFLNKTSSCSLCVDVCPVDAIEPGKPPVFDADKCQGC